MRIDGRALLLVRSGTPIEVALEQAVTLMECSQALIMDLDANSRPVHINTLQFINDLALTLVAACYDGLCIEQSVLRS